MEIANKRRTMEMTIAALSAAVRAHLEQSKTVIRVIFRGSQISQERLIYSILDDISELALSYRIPFASLDSLIASIEGFFASQCEMGLYGGQIIDNYRDNLRGPYERSLHEKNSRLCTYRRGQGKTSWYSGHGADPDARQQWKLANRRKSL